MLVRVLGPEAMPRFYNETVLAAGALWLSAYAIYLVVYWPVLTGPDTRSASAAPTT